MGSSSTNGPFSLHDFPEELDLVWTSWPTAATLVLDLAAAFETGVLCSFKLKNVVAEHLNAWLKIEKPAKFLWFTMIFPIDLATFGVSPTIFGQTKTKTQTRGFRVYHWQVVHV